MITVVGTIKISDWRDEYFVRSLKSVRPIANLLSWRLNIAGKKREEARDQVVKRWTNALITNDDNETCTYDLISAQLEDLSDDALVYPWVEDVWFVCPHVNMFLYILDKFIQSKAEVMITSHLVTVWKERHFVKPIVEDKFYSEHLIDLPTQELIWKNVSNPYWTISIPSLFKVGLFRELLQHQKEHLSQSYKPGGLELPPDTAEQFLKERSFIRLVPHFHVFREVVGFQDPPIRCIIWYEAREAMDLRDHGGKFGGFPKE